MKKLLIIFLLLFPSCLLAQSTQERIPTGQGVYDNWDASSGPEEYQDVDEYQASPGDSDYMYINDSIGTQTHTYTDFDITSSSITNVTVYYRCRESSGQTRARSTLVVNGTPYNDDSTKNLTGSFKTYSYPWTINPDTSVAWTEADVEGVGSNPLEEFGVQNQGTTGGEGVECSQNSILVTYTEAAPPSGLTSRQPLLGVGR